MELHSAQTLLSLPQNALTNWIPPRHRRKSSNVRTKTVTIAFRNVCSTGNIKIVVGAKCTIAYLRDLRTASDGTISSESCSVPRITVTGVRTPTWLIVR